MTDQTARTPYAHKIRYGITGAPILTEDEMDGSHAPGVGVEPALIELVYRAALDGKPTSVDASVTGWWTRHGRRDQPESQVATHFKNGPDGWPAWLAEEARLHDPHAPAGQAPATALGGAELEEKLDIDVPRLHFQPTDRAATEERAARWETAALKAGREVDRNALRVYMAVADDEQAELRRMVDEAQQPAPWLSDSARIGRTLIWTWADIGKGVYGQGYRAAQTEVRALLTGQRDSDEAQQPETQTLPQPEGPEYTPCACDHIEPEHEPNAGACWSCDCEGYRATPAAPLRRSWDDCPGFPERCPNILPVDPNPPVHYGGIRCGCADRPAVEAQQPSLAVEDCTCIPFTRQGGVQRYCQPGDTVDMISGWEIGGDCPHHRDTVKAQQPARHIPCPDAFWLRRPEAPHDWQQGPDAQPVHCPGVPAAQQPKEARS